jgi:hypothetical protein
VRVSYQVAIVLQMPDVHIPFDSKRDGSWLPCGRFESGPLLGWGILVSEPLKVSLFDFRDLRFLDEIQTVQIGL